MNKVSIIIPVFNREKFISDAINSCIMQTYKNIEIIIFDNCSTDKTWNICQDFSKKNSIIQIYQNQKNLGPVLNWENCITKCNGIYVKFLFSDDILYENCIEEMVKYFEQDVGFVFSSIDVGVSKKNSRNEYCWKCKTGIYESSEFINSLLWSGKVPVSPGASLFRLKDLYKWIDYRKNNPELQKFRNNGAGLDALMYLLAAKSKNRVAYIKNPLCFFRAHPDSLTIKDQNKSVSENYIKFFLWFVDKEFNEEIYKKILLKYWMSTCIREGKFIKIKTLALKYDFKVKETSIWSFINNFIQVFFLKIYWKYIC